ncbi:TIGR03084 family metal-binding protein [Williamsia sp. CHRR-6]|uniref:TIGR03084 family metal-binding protein n=1 Tax=Williamsia sp. CHRR-6 TaxID=2835871 RepID=UPI001BDB37E7|nr:TIGR03084 family metal-binding protein [Williamsia sp. CHRR-6]MBT0565810.1 TIGR03084 family protein [Williamsia sp. CHRR-6]
MSAARDLVADLLAEADALDRLVADLDADQWRRSTPAPGWTIAHQIGHLMWTDEVALRSVTEPEKFAADLQATDPDGFVDRAAEEAAALEPAELLARWRTGREALAHALNALAAGTSLAWFGPPMSVASMATARLMETWAHGLDVADALGVPVEPTARLRAVAHIGVRTRDFSFLVNGATPPGEPFRVELIGPGGECWDWGPVEAAQRVSGPALDFCLLVTQRRALADLALTFEGPEAIEWSTIAQCFAGPPGAGRVAHTTETSPA